MKPDNSPDTVGQVTPAGENSESQATVSSKDLKLHEPLNYNQPVSNPLGEPANSLKAVFADQPSSDEPIPVAKVLSTRGLEYLFMSVCLWLGAGSLILILLTIVYGRIDLLAFPLSVLLVCVPIFVYLFLRLKRAEFVKPSLRLDASKRRMSQITQVLAFLTCLITAILLVFAVFEKIAGGKDINMVKTVLSVVIILLIAGGILTYYWFDEHRQRV